MTQSIPKQITRDIGDLLSRLAELGYMPTRAQYDAQSFGNYFVDLGSEQGWLRIVRDRNQYFVDVTSKEQLKNAGLFRAFDDRKEFERALLSWLSAA
jgi:hypothetical protein